MHKEWLIFLLHETYREWDSVIDVSRNIQGRNYLLTYCPICRWHVGQQQRFSISVFPWPSFQLFPRCCSWSSSLLLQYASMCFSPCHACAFLLETNVVMEFLSFLFFSFLGMLYSKYFANYIVYRFLSWRPQKRQWTIKERPFQVGEGRPMLFFFQIQSPNNLTMQFHDNIVLNKEKFDAVKHVIYKTRQTRRSSRPISAETALPRLQSGSRLVSFLILRFHFGENI